MSFFSQGWWLRHAVFRPIKSFPPPNHAKALVRLPLPTTFPNFPAFFFQACGKMAVHHPVLGPDAIPSRLSEPADWTLPMAKCSCHSLVPRSLVGSFVALLDDVALMIFFSCGLEHRGSNTTAWSRDVGMRAGRNSQRNNHCIFRLYASGLHANILPTVTWTKLYEHALWLHVHVTVLVGLHHGFYLHYRCAMLAYMARYRCIM